MLTRTFPKAVLANSNVELTTMIQHNEPWKRRLCAPPQSGWASWHSTEATPGTPESTSTPSGTPPGCRWVRKPVFRAGAKKISDTIGIFDWYKLCQKVLTLRRNILNDVNQRCASTWKAMCLEIERERPGESKSNIRREVRLRILNLTNRFITDIARFDAGTKAQVLRVFDEWEQTSIARSIDPNWGGDKFWDLVTNEAPLTDWLPHGTHDRPRTSRMAGPPFVSTK